MKIYVVLYRKETGCADWNEVRIISSFIDEDDAKKRVDELNENPSLDSENKYGDSLYLYEECELN